MASNAPRYVGAVEHIINHSAQVSVKSISFKSKQQSKNKESSPLRNVVQGHAAAMRPSGWDLKYKFNPDRSHELEFASIPELPIERSLTLQLSQEAQHESDETKSCSGLRFVNDVRSMEQK